MDKDNPSRYKRHLAYLNLKSDVSPDDLPSKEKEEIDSIQLRPLQLKEKQSSFLFPWLTGLAIASAALLFIIVPIVQQNDQPTVTFKGETQISVIAERNGEFVTFSENEAQAGDRINFEVIASTPVKIYLMIYDRAERELLTKTEVLSTEVLIPAGQKATFANAITLTDENDGERAAVVVCPQDVDVQRSEVTALDFSACSRKMFIFRP
ncbi:hypothetical protein [Oligoflexus tunisiensis]|uniref:hypothetical protein n=1 Tax=Oligoflexus tunisiensis TaxID=708132 RepID=UPI00114CD492|nr:hypothetical protein [Oligoflexus tunisiensis]